MLKFLRQLNGVGCLSLHKGTNSGERVGRWVKMKSLVRV